MSVDVFTDYGCLGGVIPIYWDFTGLYGLYVWNVNAAWHIYLEAVLDVWLDGGYAGNAVECFMWNTCFEKCSVDGQRAAAKQRVSSALRWV